HLSNFNVIFEDSIVVDIEAAATIDDVGGTFDVKLATAAIAFVDNVGSYTAFVVSDIIDVFDFANIASVGAFESVTDLNIANLGVALSSSMLPFFIPILLACS
ncbi:33875_t:CDS:2, partial [Gigaspora margarita]